jgi:hypothetical protein
MFEFEDMTASEITTNFSAIMEALKRKLATHFLKIHVDEIFVNL